jgi:ATP synthase protein I
MNDFSTHLKQVQRVTIFFLSFCFLGWALLPQYQSEFAGLIVGTTVSYFNSKYLAWKIEQLGQAAAEKTNRKINLGFITRASMALIAVMASLKYAQIEFSTTLLGLFSVQLATLLLGILSLFQSKRSKR